MNVIELMSVWRLALMGCLCCMTMRESVVQVANLLESRLAANADHRELPGPNSNMPAPLEGDEAEWLAVDGEEHGQQFFCLVSEPKLLTEQISCDAAHGGGSTPRALLKALHRLRI
jgi:hypothetical protein